MKKVVEVVRQWPFIFIAGAELQEGCEMVWSGATEQIFDETRAVAVVDAGGVIDMDLMGVVRLDNIRDAGDGLLSHFGGKAAVRCHEMLSNLKQGQITLNRFCKCF
jgi:hypothetical protein